MVFKSLPSTMRALLHNQKTNTLSIQNIPLPTPSPTQYLIRCQTAAFTTGELLWPRPEELTMSTPGVEFAGTVITSPSAKSKFQPGQQVYGSHPTPADTATTTYAVKDNHCSMLSRYQ